jgi:CBS domain-containing protein
MQLERVLETVGVDREKLPRFIRPAEKRGFPMGPLWFVLGAAATSAVAYFMTQPPRIVRGTSGKKVRDVMIDRVITIPASATLMEAAQRMRDSNVGVLPVLDGEQVVGVVTDRDLVVRGVARHASAGAVPVGEVSTKLLVCADPSWDVERAMQMMREHRIGRLPVVDESKRVVGILTLSSLALRSGEEGEALETAQEVSQRSARA